jgi:hypothetical protein
MDKSAYYRQYICQILTAEAKKDLGNPDIENQLIFDREGDRYLLLDVGWQGLQRIHTCFIHLDIKEGKIWIQHNMTEVDIAQKSVEMGVPKEDIVFGLHPPYKRPYTGYGTTDLAS